MKPVAILPPFVDSTMMTCFRSCPEKFRLEFIYGLRTGGISIDLHAGGCFALALEECYRGIWESNLPLPKALERAQGAFAVAWGDFEIPEYKKTAKTYDRVWAAVEAYFEKFPPHTDHTKPYFVNGKPTFEFTFSIPLEPVADHDDMSWGRPYDPANKSFPLHPITNEPWMYCGRFDMLGEYMGRPVVRDEKTTGRSISTGWAEQWNLRSQFMGYVWACQQSGLDLDSVVIRGIAIQKTQTPIEEAIKVFPRHKIARWHEQLRRDLWRIRRAWDEGYFDFNFGDACTAYGSCMFMDVCGAAEREPWMNQFTVNRWNPLLKNPIQEIATP